MVKDETASAKNRALLAITHQVFLMNNKISVYFCVAIEISSLSHCLHYFWIFDFK